MLRMIWNIYKSFSIRETFSPRHKAQERISPSQRQTNDRCNGRNRWGYVCFSVSDTIWKWTALRIAKKKKHLLFYLKSLLSKNLLRSISHSLSTKSSEGQWYHSEPGFFVSTHLWLNCPSPLAYETMNSFTILNRPQGSQPSNHICHVSKTWGYCVMKA